MMASHPIIPAYMFTLGEMHSTPGQQQAVLRVESTSNQRYQNYFTCKGLFVHENRSNKLSRHFFSSINQYSNQPGATLTAITCSWR